ncbi:MAG TPA: AAA family ATPase [Pirellulales bacterium]|nr:AAA family ATPase [Pirellulales bacterium]
MATATTFQTNVENWLAEIGVAVIEQAEGAFVVRCLGNCGGRRQVNAETGESMCESCEQHFIAIGFTRVHCNITLEKSREIVERHGLIRPATSEAETAGGSSKPAPKVAATAAIPRFQEPHEILDRQGEPHSLRSEKGLLACILLDPHNLAEVGFLQPDEFYNPDCRRVFEAMRELAKEGKLVDESFLYDRLVASMAIDGREALFLKEIADTEANAHNAVLHAKEIIKKASQRNVHKAAVRMLQLAADNLAASRGHDNWLKEVREVAAAATQQSRAADSKRFQIYNSAELAGMKFQENAIIENVMIEGQPGGLFGGTKMLKTTLAVDAGISIASATDFLGCEFFRVPQARRVMIMSAESGLKELQRNARRIAEARDLELAELQYLLWSDRVPFLGTDADPAILAEQVKEHGVEVLFLDPAYQMLDPRDSGNLFAQGIQLRRLLDVCRDAGCDFMLLHHTTRTASRQYEQPTLTDASWAGFSEFVGQWMLVARRRPYVAGSGTHELWLEFGARGAHQAGWALDVDERSDECGRPQAWSATIRAASEVRAEAEEEKAAKEARKASAAQERNAKRLNDDKAAVLKLLAELPSGETKNKIRADAHLNSHERTVAAVDALLEEGKIVECEIRKSGQKTPQAAYKLKAVR